MRLYLFKNIALYYQKGYSKNIRKELLFYEAGLSNLKENIKYSINGKPYLEDGPAFSFSDTYNGSILAITKDYATIGIDMEIERQCSYFPFIARHYFVNEERQYCMEESNDSIDLSRFFEIWVKKEAIIKSKGGSIYDNLRAFNAFSPYYVERLIYKQIDFSQIYHIAIYFA